MLEEKEQFAKAIVLNKFFLEVNAVKEHGCDGNNDHLLIDGVNLRERLQDLRNDIVTLDFLLCLLMNTQVCNGCHHIAEDLLLPIMVEHIE